MIINNHDIAIVVDCLMMFPFTTMPQFGRNCIAIRMRILLPPCKFWWERCVGLPIRSVCNVHILQPLLIDFAYIFFLPKGQRNEFTALQYFFYSDEVDYDCNNLNCLKNLYKPIQTQKASERYSCSVFSSSKRICCYFLHLVTSLSSSDVILQDARLKKNVHLHFIIH